MNADLADLDKIMAKPEFWDDTAKAQDVGRERTQIADRLDFWNSLEQAFEEIQILLDLALEENDDETGKEVQARISSLEDRLEQFEVMRMLSGDNDRNNAIVDIHAGAGGTEAQDWAEMLFRMYLRWADRNSFEVKVVDMLDGDEAGIKSVTFTLNGEYAYGLMRPEIGIHRLVRISPFDASNRRHTSFASVFVVPEIEDDIVIEINEKDLRIDTYRASGRGRPARQQNQFGRAHDPSAHRHRGPVPGRKVPAPQPGNRHEGPQIQAIPTGNAEKGRRGQKNARQ